MSSDKMTITYWGVRGSIPSPGDKTLRYGGETSCVSIEVGDTMIILDAGTGIRQLGRRLANTTGEINILISHVHMDHVRGFPFFDPIYESGRPINLFPYTNGRGTWYPSTVMDGVHFPRNVDDVPANLIRVETPAGEYFAGKGIAIKQFGVNHPGGAQGFMVSYNGKSFVHVPDNEIDRDDASYEELKSHIRGVTVLSHDAQLTDGDLPAKTGWGHSTISNLCQLAIETQPETLVLFHHDPERSDDELDEIGREARQQLIQRNIECLVSHEGMTITF